MRGINLIKQTPPSLITASESVLLPHARHSSPSQDSWKIIAGCPKTMKRTFSNRTWTPSMFCFCALRRLEELCSLLSCADPLIILILVMLKYLSKLGFKHAKHTVLNKSRMWQPLNSSKSLKQMLLLVAGEEAAFKSEVRVSIYNTEGLSCLSGLGILVETGNSVDYSLAIRLLSLWWLSLLHHEIAWLSTRLESGLCSSLAAPATASPLALPFPQLWKKKGVRLAPLRSARQYSGKTGWLAVQSLLPHFLWPQFYPPFFCCRNMFYDGYT